MKQQLSVNESEAAQAVKVVPAQELSERIGRTRERIALRAYEIFESHGRSDGRDLDDWLRAESELLHRLPHTVAETRDALIVFAELPGFWKADELLIGVEPHRLIVSGERKAQITYSDVSGTRMENRLQSILRVLDVKASLDTERATASLTRSTLEIRIPKKYAARTANAGER